MSAPQEQLPIVWQLRPTPLSPVAVAARGEVAARLAVRLLRLTDQELAQLSGVAGTKLLVLTGASGSLPWVDGVSYLGRDAAAPALLLPTVWQPSVPSALLERALLARYPRAAPLAVLPAETPLLVSLATARPVARQVLKEFLTAL